MRRWAIWLPFAAFAATLWVVAGELPSPAKRVAPEPIARPLPRFTLRPMIAGKPGVSSADFGRGEPRLLNVFASWCVPCIAESPQLMALRRAGVRIDAIALRDRPESVGRFLRDNGDPFASIGDDATGAARAALGTSGVPETLVIDGTGRIVRQHAGDIHADEVAGLIATVRSR